MVCGLPIKLLVSQQTEAPTKDPRHPHKSSRRGISNGIGSIFVWACFHLLLKICLPKNDDVKIDAAWMDAPRRELSNVGLGSGVSLSVVWKNNVLCVCMGGGAIQL